MEKEKWSRLIIPIIITAILSSVSGGLVTHTIDRAKEKRLIAQAEYNRRRTFYQQMKLHLDASYDAFSNQVFARGRLVKLLEKNHGTLPRLQYEELFRGYYPELNEEEKILFEFIRGITETSLYKHNKEMLGLLEKYPEYYDELPELRTLYEHLDLWMSKYNSLFVNREDTCLVYVGVEEEKPFPRNITAKIVQLITELEDEGIESN